MAAVLKITSSRDEIEGRGHDLLETWALFRRGGEREGLPRAGNAGWSEPLDKEHANEPDSVLAIDRILAGLAKSGYEHTVEIVHRFYLGGSSVWQICETMHRTRGFVLLTIRGVCWMVEERVAE